MSAIDVKLNVFEGPLDLLLHLIEKNKVNIYDIPIVTITEQYLEYVNNMEEEDLDVMSEFLVMAATLIKIKSRMLLPRMKRQRRTRRIRVKNSCEGCLSTRYTNMRQENSRI